MSPSENRLVRSPVFRGAMLLLGLFLVLSLITRAALLYQTGDAAAPGPSILPVFLEGMLYDLAAGIYLIIPWVLLALIWPPRAWPLKAGRCFASILFALYTLVLLFNAVAEWFFWDEFQVRYNFIAIDYLVWTQEVWGNIRESYPIPAIAAGLLLLTSIIQVGLAKSGLVRWVCAFPDTVGSRCRVAAITAIAAAAGMAGLSPARLPHFANEYRQELARNGLFSLGTACWDMELDFERFYPVLEGDKAMARCRELLETDSGSIANRAGAGLERTISSAGPERKWNVILICMESLSADFMAAFGNKKGLTPCLDQLTRESLFFSNCYATGTRTVRGMEALTLGLPPTPGQAILYRPNSTGLVTIATPFQERGYDCAFLYGGDGRFDYMNRYFRGNGWRVLDKNTWQPSDISYETSWGACDEDLYRKVLSEADAGHAAGRPFYFFGMTTSNHRPFKYPDGKIDIPADSGRRGAVKYHDFAIGQFIEAARGKPWFAETLFVFCSDHCASSAGKAELDVTKYRIPALIWNPGLVSPRKYSRLCSQIDVMPTVLGLLNWRWESRSFGFDVLAPQEQDLRRERAFVSNYQKVALLRPEGLAILQPMKKSGVFHCDFRNGDLSENPGGLLLLEDSIAYYQGASRIFKTGGLSAVRQPDGMNRRDRM